MTWKEFKEKAEEQGIKDDMEVSFIDWYDTAEVLVVNIIEDSFSIE